MPTLKAIDLYSGVGGWSLGLRMAGIDIKASYELWGPANQTNFNNNRHQAQTVDIRALSLDEIPKGIDIVVGSPPCTQFSFSNRGGGGDIEDGLQDLITFLTIVDHVRPKVWVMENVPRAGTILKEEMKPGGRLRRFSHLGIEVQVINMEDFGLPQRRKRCIAGNLDFKLLSTYTTKLPRRKLGNVVHAFAADTIVDPLYGIMIERSQLNDHIAEDFLNEEEVRINRANKLTHPVYNSMPFPDNLGRSVRTITATCTRVSRESIVIEDLENAGSFRRLTLRERASLQGFPITFEFYGASYAQKLRMIGNAMPPLVAYYIAQALKGTKVRHLRLSSNAKPLLLGPLPKPAVTAPDTAGAKFREHRTFRFAIPSLRLKSGVRFELSNTPLSDVCKWLVSFYFGTSKSIHEISLNKGLYDKLARKLPKLISPAIQAELNSLKEFLGNVDVVHMQDIWSHRGPGRTRPFMLLDRLDQAGRDIQVQFNLQVKASRTAVTEAISDQHGQNAIECLPGIEKLMRNAPLIHAGLLVGSLANSEMESCALRPNVGTNAAARKRLVRF